MCIHSNNCLEEKDSDDGEEGNEGASIDGGSSVGGVGTTRGADDLSPGALSSLVASVVGVLDSGSSTSAATSVGVSRDSEVATRASELEVAASINGTSGVGSVASIEKGPSNGASNGGRGGLTVAVVGIAVGEEGGILSFSGATSGGVAVSVLDTVELSEGFSGVLVSLGGGHGRGVNNIVDAAVGGRRDGVRDLDALAEARTNRGDDGLEAVVGASSRTRVGGGLLAGRGRASQGARLVDVGAKSILKGIASRRNVLTSEGEQSVFSSAVRGSEGLGDEDIGGALVIASLITGLSRDGRDEHEGKQSSDQDRLHFFYSKQSTEKESQDRNRSKKIFGT